MLSNTFFKGILIKLKTKEIKTIYSQKLVDLEELKKSAPRKVFSGEL
ncbi:MAG: hypothetical protein Q7U36_00575 [bacterium]|nr:hypothetical protein [bacterium]